MRTPAVKPAHALPFLLIPSAARRDTAYLPLFERAAVTRHLDMHDDPNSGAQMRHQGPCAKEAVTLGTASPLWGSLVV